MKWEESRVGSGGEMGRRVRGGDIGEGETGKERERREGWGGKRAG